MVKLWRVRRGGDALSNLIGRHRGYSEPTECNSCTGIRLVRNKKANKGKAEKVKQRPSRGGAWLTMKFSASVVYSQSLGDGAYGLLGIRLVRVLPDP